MVKVGFLGLGAQLPERVMSNDEWAHHVDTTPAWIVERTGIERRRIAGPGETTVTLAVGAARSALADAGLEAAAIDEIILATDTPEVFIPDTAAFVQHLLGCREIPCYDLAGSGCAGFLTGVDLACSRVRTGQRHVLVIGVEVLSKVMSWRDRATCVLFGDAGAAAVVGQVEAAGEVLAVVAGTDGSKTGILGKEVGGTRLPFSAETLADRTHDRLTMNGREVFREAVFRMSSAARQVLERCGRRIEEVAWFVPHQANLRILRAVSEQLGVAQERVYVNVQDYGNTGSASVPLALWEARAKGLIRAGDLVLLAAFGAGFHWAAALVQY